MAISFKSVLGLHPEALNMRLYRTEVLANNIANADTPYFKARDIDFKQEMRWAKVRFNENTSSTLAHMPQIKYHEPYQSSEAKNTVELHLEQAKFAKNSQDYQTSLTFLTMRLKGLKQAIDGK